MDSSRGRYFKPTRQCRLCRFALIFCIAGALRSADAATGFCISAPGSCWPSAARIRAWISTLSNSTTVYTPDAEPNIFLSEATAMNFLKSDFPGLIVVPGSEADLRSALYFASKTRIRVVVRCSGHDFNGRSSGRGVMLIKTERLNWTSYDASSQTISFGAGANHEIVYTALVPHNRMYVGGQSKTVCPAGCLAGGCHGLLSRQYGLGIDSILEIRFALFNGTIITLNRTRYADLFNAYLGAGQNSFGIAVSFKAQTYPAPPVIIMLDAEFVINSPFVTSGNLLTNFFLNTTWFNEMPRQLSGTINLDSGRARVKFVYTGTDYDDLSAKLAPLLASPFRSAVAEPQFFSNLAEMALNMYPAETEIWGRKYITSGFLPPDQDTLDSVASVIATTNPYMWLWFVFGGAVPEKAGIGSVPDGMRYAMYEVLFGTHWFNPNDDRLRVESLEPYLPLLYGISPTSYSNEFTSWGSYNDIQDWKTRFFSNYSNLLAVKKKYDPCNLITATYAVGSDEPVAICSCAPKSA
ncbi:hypothetical protein VOLCADRAFT_102791 [Volvox carteri f. nagariensis]|uniref:FAD-binding PCMH-type domain-containing protein n=1 Tax=Volvox carteri f. nagariensis TaxID=3068 RepID=D8TI34_VOLCA|nr:uncharacterized protein VOLCADRAFT_102791 [Volvox carteri f. nagariensis]EFJ53169.1 hypothetical protein VOLCADRAFT_102791 [Volvox carteri f. nagariensis]|eukprot:XP_002946174.1 hypothetical protein VOLCADRAFT_102791 [Volvox carteri f. nagariensis]